MPLDSARTINAFRSGYEVGQNYRKQQREKELNDILGKAYDPGMTQAQVDAVPTMIRDPGLAAREPGFRNALAPLAQAGFGREAMALQQAQRNQELGQKAALIDAMLKGAQYDKTRATTINPIDLEREKSNLRGQELMKMMEALGIKLPAAPGGPSGVVTPGSPPQITPQGAGFTKNINGKLYVKIGPNPMDWAEWGGE